jgi:hypothetical protein
LIGISVSCETAIAMTTGNKKFQEPKYDDSVLNIKLTWRKIMYFLSLCPTQQKKTGPI